MLLPALTLALIGTAAQAADNGVYLGAGVSQVKLDNVGKDFNSGNLNDFKLDDTSWKLIGGFRPIDNFAAELNYFDLGNESKSVGGPELPRGRQGVRRLRGGFHPDWPHRPVRQSADWCAGNPMPAADGPLGFRFDDKGTEFGWGVGAQARLGSLGARLEYEQFDVDHSDGVEALSLSAFWTFL